MSRVAIAAALVVAASTAAWASNSHARSGAGGGQPFDARVTLVNAPGGAYIQCDPRNPSSPVRCTPDGW